LPTPFTRKTAVNSSISNISCIGNLDRENNGKHGKGPRPRIGKVARRLGNCKTIEGETSAIYF